MRKRRRGQHAGIGVTKSYILKFAIENWDGFFESDLRDYLWKELQIRDKATVNRHLKELSEKEYILKSEKDNQNYYKVNPSKLNEILENRLFSSNYEHILQTLKKSEKFAEYLVERLPLKVDVRFLLELLRYSNSFLKFLIIVSSKNVTTIDALIDMLKPNVPQWVLSRVSKLLSTTQIAFTEEKFYFIIWKHFLYLDLENEKVGCVSEILKKVIEINELLWQSLNISRTIFNNISSFINTLSQRLRVDKDEFLNEFLERLCDKFLKDKSAKNNFIRFKEFKITNLDELKLAIHLEINLLQSISSFSQDIYTELYPKTRVVRVIDGEERKLLEDVIEKRFNKMIRKFYGT